MEENLYVYNEESGMYFFLEATSIKQLKPTLVKLAECRDELSKMCWKLYTKSFKVFLTEITGDSGDIKMCMRSDDIKDYQDRLKQAKEKAEEVNELLQRLLEINITF